MSFAKPGYLCACLLCLANTITFYKRCNLSSYSLLCASCLFSAENPTYFPAFFCEAVSALPIKSLSFQVDQEERERWQQPVQPLWQALNTLMAMMSAKALLHLHRSNPTLAGCILDFAQQGTSVSWPAVGCLKTMFQTLRQQASLCLALISS